MSRAAISAATSTDDFAATATLIHVLIGLTLNRYYLLSLDAGTVTIWKLWSVVMYWSCVVGTV